MSRLMSGPVILVMLIVVSVACDNGGNGTTDSRYTITPAQIGGFGHETITVSDRDCGFPQGASVQVQGVDAVLVEVSSDGCSLTFDVQGGQGGDAPIVVNPLASMPITVEGFSYLGSDTGGLFSKSMCVGDSLGAAMDSWYLSYESQVKNGMFAFFFRQARAYCPHPLVRMEGMPSIITLEDMEAEDNGEISMTSVVLTAEMTPYILGEEPWSGLRLNVGTAVCNQSVPGMHDVTWPFYPTVYDPGDTVLMYEELLRFPDGIPDNPTPIMDVVAQAKPTFIAVSPGVAAYALDSYHVSVAQLDLELDTFLNGFLDIDPKPVVMLGTMPDTSSLPARPFTYAERYYNIRVSNQLYAAAERANEAAGEKLFVVVPLGEFLFDWFGADTQVQAGEAVYPIEMDDSGRPCMVIADSSGVDRRICPGRFQGFFSLDHVHLTPTGHAMTANLMIETINDAFGPDSDTPKLAELIPYIDITKILDRDPQTMDRLSADAAGLGLPDLATYLDPVPPVLSHGERCAVTHGPHADTGLQNCPAAIEVTVNGDPCTADAISLPADITLTVKDDQDGVLDRMAVGVYLLPVKDGSVDREKKLELLKYLPGGLTDSNGVLEFTLTADQIENAQAGGWLYVRSGTAEALCRLP